MIGYGQGGIFPKLKQTFQRAVNSQEIILCQSGGENPHRDYLNRTANNGRGPNSELDRFRTMAVGIDGDKCKVKH